MNRPRPSILQLFDPLSSRDTNSPESDKENTVPDSEFFPQTFVKHPSPVRLTRRLIEVGDATVLEATGEEGSVCGEEMKEDEEDTVGPHPLSSPRTPLGDVTFDRERTPMRSKMYRRKANPTTTAILDGAPDDYAFASVIDAVNASGATFDASTVAPSVVISSAEDSPSSSVGDTDTLSTSVATLSLATPTGSLIADTIMTFPTPSEPSTSLLVPVAQPPHQATSIASFDMDRSSTDLQSSFALHMNMDSADSSFDLLNDRISFLGHGDEESFDTGAVGNATSEEGSKDNDTSATFPDRSHVNRGQDLIFTSVDNPGQRPVKHSPNGRQSRSESPLFQLSSALLEIPDTGLID
ncbi:hypothetical protein B0H11DRAFT_377224 [Mycena galericulata]|nr:hypothetical protein B0H11DRAFT_377224 [Mycena galericulata]